MKETESNKIKTGKEVIIIRRHGEKGEKGGGKGPRGLRGYPGKPGISSIGPTRPTGDLVLVTVRPLVIGCLTTTDNVNVHPNNIRNIP